MKPQHLLIALGFAVLPFGALAETINVAVAANVQYVFDDLAREFQKETGIEAKGAFGPSGKFATQIANGAPFDVFMSADMEFPQKLHEQGLTSSAPKPYAYGTLVLWSTKGVDLKNWQKTLLSPSVNKVAVANPKTAPYGREAMRALAHYKLTEALTPKLVYGESIAQASQYIASGVADAGFTAKSVVIAPEMKGQGQWVEVPKAAYEPIAQGAVVLKHGQETAAQASKKFYDFLFSGKARSIFERNGYTLP
ncbi:molybdate ABC transporter substrate-binding protein [Crenobacter sp. SG2303]|uniref:Molybdate ABC transporter substrate-binding protein n=1 Tax=Crenobacter oryzisoli TaxID=3056844 RepID=A0ABT7XRU5_9NEIS|nr:molybdate ABC transporter substrate-binding protein [Crenobacter sp. SG2303]MDN0076518.1 molybdate ABC transporter substrate-binding protein [Crenobacter sp. SG2303]